MPDVDEYSDEYLAKALKDDARESSIKYSALGLQAFLPKRATGAAPKPNTRFLRNILRETDSHNAALLAKEKREAKERENALNRNEPGRLSPLRERDRDLSREGRSDSRKKRRRDSRSRSRSRSPRFVKRRAIEGRDEERRRKYRRRRSHSPDNFSRADLSEDRHKERHTRRRSKDGQLWEEARHRHHRRRLRSRSDSRSGRKRRSKDKQRSSRSPSLSSQSPQPRSLKETRDSEAVNGRLKGSNFTTTQSESLSDSDPLDAIIGPAPPPPESQVKAKGRGAFKTSSAAMDSHFASNYDPNADVQPDPETEDDWEQALEALRDRQKWKQQGADRLRAAGFSESEVKKWEKGDIKDESDVTWAKKGEGREWDRGKVVTDEMIMLKPSW